MTADVCSPSIEKSPSIHAHSPPNPTIVALQRIFRGDLFVLIHSGPELPKAKSFDF